MENEKHTAGPWSVEGLGIKAIVRAANGVIVAIRHRLGAGEHEANARLIAAAPELLEALRDCVLVMERDLEGLKVIQPELNAARAAIAKATGGK